MAAPSSGDGLEAVVGEQVEAIGTALDVVTAFAIEYGFQLLGALVFLAIGLKVVGWMGRRITGMLEAKNVDVTLARFLGNALKLVLMVLLVIITLGNFGISIAPLIALAGASAFGATVAIQGPLSNYGAGISIILGRLFQVGDTITVRGNASGVVREITLAYTRLVGEDGEEITVPNKEIVGRVIVNSETRRVVQTKIAVRDGQDLEAAKRALRTVVSGFPELAGGPAVQVGVHDFAYGGVVLGLRFWVPSKRYFELRYAVNDAALAALRKAGVALMPAAPAAIAQAALAGVEDDGPEEALLTGER